MIDVVGVSPAGNDALAFYERFYTAIAASRAYAEFCERVFGRNFGQHGFADMAQLDTLIDSLAIQAGDRVLDLGCGNGAMAAYVAEVTGASVTGVDFSPTAIDLAQCQVNAQPGRLLFQVADIACLPFQAASFDVLTAIDTLYFTELDATIARLKELLAPGGRMGIYWSQGANPEVPIEVFPRETLPPDNTDLARALQHHALAYRSLDFTAADLQHARLKRAILLALRPWFEAEDNMFLYDNRLGEAEGVIAAGAAGVHARYLYCVSLPAA